MTLAAGTRIGPYEVGPLLGAGGMGEVYRAHDAKLNRDVALKILPPLFNNDPDRLARFHREAQLLASLNHPNIGHIYGLEDGDGRPALVLELIEGPTLAERIAQGPLPLDEALPIAKQIADALEAAHDHGVIHRDLKPANIKVCRDGTVKVLDFGLARALDPAPASGDAMNSPTLTARATQTGLVVGTAAYMSPEQARGRDVDRRADIWAFGVVLYEMLAATLAFGGETVTDTLAAIVHRDPDWSRLPAVTPPRIHQVLRRCVEKDVKRRLRDIADVRLEIVDTLEAKPDAAGSVPATARPAAASKWPLAWATCASLSVLLLAFAWWLLPRTAATRVVTRVDVVTPPTSEPGSFAVSPSGRQVVFSADVAGGIARLWLRSLDQRTAKPLAGTEDGIEPFWSPDDRAIGFFAAGKLKRLDLTTGLVQGMAAAPAPRGGTWNADNTIVFAPNTTSGLYRVSSNGGPATELTHLSPNQYSHRWPHFLPDGKRLLFSTFLGQAATRGLFLVSLDGGEPRRILDASELGDAAPVYAEPGALLLLRQRLLVARRFDPDRGLSGDAVPIAEDVGNDTAMFRPAISVSSGGVLMHRSTGTERRQLQLVDRTGRVLGAIGPADENGLSYPTLGPDGQRVAVSRALDGNADIWIIDMKRGTFTRVTSDPSNELAPVWSPDGTLMAFRSSRAGSFDIYLKSMAGTGGAETPLVVDGRTKSALDWTPDSGTLLYGSVDPQTGADLWAVPVTGDRKSYVVLRTPFDEMDAHISPDGRWMAYRSNESGRFEIYVRPFAREAPNQVVQLISTSGGSQPCWSPNGKELFYLSPDGQMMAVALDVSPDRLSISSGTPVALFAAHLASGTFITTAGTGGRAQYDVTRDGHFLLNSASQDYVPQPISVVLNWDLLLPPKR